MNLFKKKQKDSSHWKPTGSFIRKPVKGWIHPDHQLQSSGVIYQCRYIGAVKILESLRTIPLDERGGIVRESINKCCLESHLFNFKKKKVFYTHGVIGDVCLDNCGKVMTTVFSVLNIKSHILASGEILLDHAMETISFASIGEQEYRNFIGYVAKDTKLFRACFIFECDAGLADDIILTIGQAFEMKYKEYLNTNPVIQPVVGRFTDPHFTTISSPLPPTSPCYSHLNYKQTLEEAPVDDYSHLFGKNGTKPRSASGGYDTLHRNQNHLINQGTDESEATINFAPGASYDKNSSEFATVYDNPIAMATARQNLLQQQNGISTYDNWKEENGFSEANSDYLSPQQIKKNDLSKEVSSPTKKNICKEKWFHGMITRESAESLINNNGDFLIRESSSSHGQYVLTGMRDGVHRHLLLVDPEGNIRTKYNSFGSIAELIKFHVENNKPIFSGSSEVYLTNEIHNIYTREFQI